MRHYSELTYEEVGQIWRACAAAAQQAAKDLGVSGLSEGCSRNVYSALGKALYSEQERAKRSR